MWYGCTEGPSCYDSHNSTVTGHNQTYFYMSSQPKANMEAKGDIAYTQAEVNYKAIAKASPYNGYCFNTDRVA